MKTHPAADIFPMLDAEAYQALKSDIDNRGLREPIRTWSGMLIDGRNRKRACDELGIDCCEDPFHGTEADAIDLIVSLNIHRRHLTASQKAAIAADLVPMYEAAAKEAKAAADRARAAEAKRDERGRIVASSDSRQAPANLPELGPSRHERESRAKAAKVTGASPRYVQAAKKLKAEAPEKFEDVKRGAVTLNAALSPNRKPEASVCPTCGRAMPKGRK